MAYPATMPVLENKINEEEIDDNEVYDGIVT